MKAILAKLRFIVVPFLFISVGFVTCYSLLNWLTALHGRLIDVDETITNVYLPYLLAWIAVLISLRPRIRALKFAKSSSPFLYELVAVLAMGVPTMVAQSYLQSATGTVIERDRVGQIHTTPRAKYYLLKHFFADRSEAEMQTTTNRGSRANDPLRVSALFACPMHDQSESNLSPVHAWLGVKYSTQINSRLDPDRINDEYRKFLNESRARLQNEDLQLFSYLERVGHTGERRTWEAAVQKSKLWDGAPRPIILMGKREAFASRNGTKLTWVFGSFGIGAAVWLAMLLFPPLDEVELRRIERGRSRKDKELQKQINFFLPHRRFFATPIIAGVNILVFLAMALAGLGVANFETRDLLSWGANYSPLVRNGEWFRWLTSMFVHGGLMHLCLNLYGLLFAGMILEFTIGTVRFAVAYLLTGIAASCASNWYHPEVVSVGASGAIFGLYGVLLVLTLMSGSNKRTSINPLLINVALFIGFNLLFGSLAIGIDNAAHIGGLLSGILLGVFFAITLRYKSGRVSARRIRPTR